MYKNYPVEEYLRVADECRERVRQLLKTRYDELESERNAVNDHYPFEDLFLKWEEVDDEEAIIEHLLSRLDDYCDGMKEGIRRAHTKMDYPPTDGA